MVGQIQHGSVFPIQLGEMDTNTPTNQTSSRFCIPSLPPIQTKPPTPNSSSESTTSSPGSKKSKGKEKLKKLLETKAMQISSSDDEDDVTQDNNPFGEPLF